MPFTPAQQQAIDHRDGHLQIIACRFGKTQVERILRLLREGAARQHRGVHLHREGRRRVARPCSSAIKAAGMSVPGLVEMYIGTIHGWCLEFMQTHLNQFLKYRMNEVQTKLLIQRNSNKSG